jgi:hypothetical protein
MPEVIIRSVICLLVFSFISFIPCGFAGPGDIPCKNDEEYIKLFNERFDLVEQVPDLNEYASQSAYDKIALGKRLEKQLQRIEESSAKLPWGFSYWMHSLNQMYRVTGEKKYLDAMLRCTRKCLAYRDDRREPPIVLWNKTKSKAWASTKYDKRGPVAHAVHTGMITFPMFEFLYLARGNEAFLAEMGDEWRQVYEDLTETLSFHDLQWRQGPEEGAGHFVYAPWDDPDWIGKPISGNQQSAMGRALWMSWKAGGNNIHRERARAVCRYVLNRMALSRKDDAYYWGYWLSEQPVDNPMTPGEIERNVFDGGEDISHGSLTASLPVIMGSHGEVLSVTDLERLSRTVVKGFGRREDGILFGCVSGDPSGGYPRNVSKPTRWLRLTPWNRQVYDRITAFQLRYDPSPSPLDIALMLRFRPDNYEQQIK